jgi:hypothetical protein
MKETVKLGYETRVVPAATDGQWKLQIYNPGTLGTNYTGDDFVGIRVGREVIRKTLRRFMTVGTQTMVEGNDQNFSIRENAAAITALGRRERYTPDQDLGTLTETGLAAAALLTRALQKGLSIQPVILPTGTDPTPLVDWTAGDTLDINDPDEGVTITARVSALTYTKTPGQLIFEPALSSESFVGTAAINQGVRQLLEEQDQIRREPPDDTPNIDRGGTGVVPTILIAAYDARPEVKAIADFVCVGTDDHVVIQQAMDYVSVLPSSLARVVLSAGHFADIDRDIIVLPTNCMLIGMGENATWLEFNSSGTYGIDARAYGCVVRDFQIATELGEI